MEFFFSKPESIDKTDSLKFKKRTNTNWRRNALLKSEALHMAHVKRIYAVIYISWYLKSTLDTSDIGKNIFFWAFFETRTHNIYRPQGKVMSVSHSVHNWSHGYSGHSLSLLRRGQYTSYWNAFLFTNLTSSATANASTQWILKAVFHLMNKFLWGKFLSMFSIIFHDLPHIPYFCCITFTYIVLLRNFLLRYRTLQIIKTNKKI